MSVPQLNTSTSSDERELFSGTLLSFTDRRRNGFFFGGMQSSSIPKYWTYRRCEGVVKSSTLPPRRLQQR